MGKNIHSINAMWCRLTVLVGRVGLGWGSPSRVKSRQSAVQTLDSDAVDGEGRVGRVRYLQVEFDVQPERGTPPVQGWVKADPDWSRTASRRQRSGSGGGTGRDPNCRPHTFKGVLW